MSILSTSIINVSKALVLLSEDSPLESAAREQFNIAMYVLESFNDEQNHRECVNRVLTHIESAYALYVPTIKTWDIWDTDRALWGKRTYANSICMIISVLHYILGNYSVSKKWMIENLDEKGSIEVPNEILDCIPNSSLELFYKNVCKTKADYQKIQDILSKSKNNYNYIFSEDSYNLSDWDHYVGW